MNRLYKTHDKECFLFKASGSNDLDRTTMAIRQCDLQLWEKAGEAAVPTWFNLSPPSLGLQVPPQKVFGPSKPTLNTF